jgi:hypothetical protein
MARVLKIGEIFKKIGESKKMAGVLKIGEEKPYICRIITLLCPDNLFWLGSKSATDDLGSSPTVAFFTIFPTHCNIVIYCILSCNLL